jgi:integrase
LIAIRKWHTFQDIKEDPTVHPSVMTVIKGIERKHGVPRKQAAAMTLNDPDKIVAYLDTQGDSLVALRDKALVLIGYYGVFRRSELVSLIWEQVRFEGKGIIIELAR